MSSALVTKGLLFVFEKYFDVIGNGRTIAVIIGLLVGAGAGAAVMAVSMFVGIWTGLLGAFVGSLLAAIFFPAPDVPLNKVAGADSGYGKVVDTRRIDMGMMVYSVIVMERAVYVVVHRDPLPRVVYEKLEKGIHPQLDGGNLILLDNILYIEAKNERPNADIHSLYIHYMSKGKRRVRLIEFPSRDAVESFVTYMERRMKTSFVNQQVPMELRRAVVGPTILLVICSLIAVGLPLLSAHWTANPPGPPVGKTEQDPAVKFAISVGPYGFAGIGAIAVIGSLIWMGFRMHSPPMMTVWKTEEPEKPAEDADAK